MIGCLTKKFAIGGMMCFDLSQKDFFVNKGSFWYFYFEKC